MVVRASFNGRPARIEACHCLGEIPSAAAAEIVDAFAQADPPCDAAVNDDGDTLGLEWRFPDGRELWIDIGAGGVVTLRWNRTSPYAEGG